MKQHFCIHCHNASFFDGINRPKFCAICGGAQSTAAAKTITAKPVTPIYEEEEEQADYDIDRLIRAVSLSSESLNKVKLKNVLGTGGDDEVISRPAMSDKDFEAFQLRMSAKTVSQLSEE